MGLFFLHIHHDFFSPDHMKLLLLDAELAIHFIISLCVNYQ